MAGHRAVTRRPLPRRRLLSRWIVTLAGSVLLFAAYFTLFISAAILSADFPSDRQFRMCLTLGGLSALAIGAIQYRRGREFLQKSAKSDASIWSKDTVLPQSGAIFPSVPNSD